MDKFIIDISFMQYILDILRHKKLDYAKPNGKVFIGFKLCTLKTEFYENFEKPKGNIRHIT